jgi:hypothetical protein
MLVSSSPPALRFAGCSVEGSVEVGVLAEAADLTVVHIEDVDRALWVPKNSSGGVTWGFALALERAGLRIEAMREPRPSDPAEKYARWQEVPLFLNFRAVKS